jgi:hypothetical protein
MPVVNIPGVGRVHFPDEMSADEIQAEASNLYDGVGRDPNTGKHDETLASIDQAMSGTAPTADRPYRYPLSLGPLGQTKLPAGALSNTARWLGSVKEENSVPIALASAGSIAFPPAAAGGLLARFGPGILAATGGGAAGGAMVESTKPQSTAGSIAGKALESGLEMGAAEVAGLGVGAVANRLIAPRLTFLDPLKGTREAAVTQVRSLADKVGETLKTTVGDDPAKFLASVAADNKMVARLTKALPARQLRAFMRFATSDVGMELAEMAAVPAATAVGGPLLGAAVAVGRSLLAPGPTVRYLSRTQLPSQLTRTLGRQTLTTGMRNVLAKYETGGGF